MTELPRSTSGKAPLEVARECSAEARRIMCDGFGRVGVSHVKGRGNVLTETDLAVERAVMEILRREYPDHAILSEESASATRSEGWMWVVDPIDGTKNFSQAIPHVAFNIALCLSSEPLVALTLHPIVGWEYTAVFGEGARCNGEPIHVSPASCIADSVVAIDLGYIAERGRLQLELALDLWPGMQSLRLPGSAALGFAYVAAAKWDIYLHSGLEPWDSAAGLLLVSEAGGICTDRDGGPATIFSEGVVAATPGVHADFLAHTAGRPWRE